MSTEVEKRDYIRELQSLLKPDSEVNALLAEVKRLRQAVDAQLFAAKDRLRIERERILALEEAQRAEEEAGADPVTTQPDSAQADQTPEPVAPAPKSAASGENIRTRTFDPAPSRTATPPARPSYVKGSYTPPPGQTQSARPPRTAHSGQSSSATPGRTSRPLGRMEMVAPPPGSPARPKTDKKKDGHRTEDRRTMNKRTLIRKGFITDDLDEERMGTRRLKNRRAKETPKFTPQRIERAVITTENLTVKILSEKIGITAQEIIKKLMILGIMTSINGIVDFPTMELVASEFGVALELRLDKTKEEVLTEYHDQSTDEEADLVKRSPVVTIMGHVDHGKTTLLDYIRTSNVAQGEAGSITQQIGAYSVEVRDEHITFLDTPGHEAFTEMRARGARVTDIAILVVAADDGVMPQTVEAIKHAKEADVPVIVAINKIDKPTANPDRIKQMLTEHGLISEEWGGDTIMVPVSAKTGQGIDKLLESILLVAELAQLRANPNRLARGTIIESRLDKGRGPVATVIVQNGTLNVGDYIVSGFTYGRIRAMVDDKGRTLKSAPPSTAVSVLGFGEVPNSGDSIMAVADEKLAKQVAGERTDKLRSEQAVIAQKVTLDDVFNRISEGQIKELNVIIKADVQGSAEALRSSLLKLSSPQARLNVIQSGVGMITKSDLMLAEVGGAIIIGYNIRPDGEIRNLAEASGIDIRTYRIIYEAIDDMTLALKGILDPKYNEVILGRAQVRNIFRITGAGTIAGSYVLSGKAQRNAQARVYRGTELIFDGKLTSLKRFKDDAREVAAGYECGIGIDGFGDYQLDDEIEIYVMELVKD